MKSHIHKVSYNYVCILKDQARHQIGKCWDMCSSKKHLSFQVTLVLDSPCSGTGHKLFCSSKNMLPPGLNSDWLGRK